MSSLSDAENNNECYIDDLSDYVLELIFTNVNPYQDFNNILCVSKRWYRVGKTTLSRMKRLFYKCSNFSWRLLEEEITHSYLLSERCSHAACYHPMDQAMYMFGGCTSTYTAFNDLWFFNLSCRVWERIIISRPPLPSAKALASLVLYKNNLILYGGFSKSSTNPIHQTTTFYKEIHLFNRSKNCWEEIICENTAPHLAGHTASIVGNFMLVFGGSMGSSYNNNVYVLDIQRRIWNMPTIPGPCPPPRYGQSQILWDDRHLVIIGGCGGPSVMFNDVWLLDFDLYGDTEWKWTQIKVENPELSPPYMWCHRACKVGQNAVVVSRPTKYMIKRSRNRRASSQQSTSTSSQRISSPDSPQDRRAVAAAFCNVALTQSINQRAGSIAPCGSGNDVLAANNKKKPMLLSSRSLDEQEHKNQRPSSTNRSFLPTSANGEQHSNLGSCNTTKAIESTNSRLSISKTSELHRACSIPAIIVGEIPKLIVTSSIDQQQQKTSTSILTNSGLDEKRRSGSIKQQQPSTSNQQPLLPQRHLNSCSSLTSISQPLDGTSTSTVDGTGETNKFGHADVVRQFYISLLKEEHDRLKIVELAENLQIEERLTQFLRERVPYLTIQEITGMIEEFLQTNDNDSDNDCSFYSNNRRFQGRLNGTRNHTLSGGGCSEIDSGYLSRYSIGSKNSLDGSSGNDGNGGESSSNSSTVNNNNNNGVPYGSLIQRRSSSNNNNNSINNSIFGQIYYRHMCIYVLRLHNVIETKTVCWEQLPVEEDAPGDIILYSIVAAHGELILFGGMQSDGGNGMDCLNVGMDRHMMNSDTFILRPRYNEM